MNLKKQYQRLFEGRQAFAKMNSLVTNDALLEAPMYDTSRPAVPRTGPAPIPGGGGRPGSEMTYPEPLDIEYFSDEINKILETIDDFHQELGSQVEMKGDESGDYQYETMEKQLSRYINGSRNQLEHLQKYLERQKGKGL